MMELPKRASLVEQVANLVRRGLQQGDWADYLPGEITLSQQLKVSRPTLRAALEILQREGLIAVSQGSRRSITGRPTRVAASSGKKTVAVMAGLPFHDLSPFSLYLINTLQEHLQDHGCKLHVHAEHRFGTNGSVRSIENLVAHTRADCWVLVGPSPVIVKWFAERNVPAIAAGGVEEGLDLPSMEVDNQAVARHAAGMFVRHGHTRIALVMSDWSFRPIEEGFREGVATVKTDAPVELQVLRNNRAVQQIQAAMNSLFASSSRPTALLVVRPKHVLTIMSHLTNSGFRIPRDVSLISMGHHPFLDDMTPSVAHYAFNWSLFGKRFAQLTHQLLRRGALPSRQILIMPEFVEGGTLAEWKAN
jgi:LacI family transcriptional regulator